MEKRPLARMQFGANVVEIWNDCVATHLPDGVAVVAAVQDTDQYRETAERLGYGSDTVRMMRDHELSHVALAHLLGLPESLVMSSVAHGYGDNYLTGLEEDLILALQKFATAAGIDLFEVFERHSRSDHADG
jgi:hypothetical protein